MDPYAKPKERKVGVHRPKISHLPSAEETRTRSERQAEKQAVVAERRAIKKSARRHLKQELEEEISKLEIRNNDQIDEEGMIRSKSRNPKLEIRNNNRITKKE